MPLLFCLYRVDGSAKELIHESGVARKGRVEGSVGNEMRFDLVSHLSQQLKRGGNRTEGS